MGFKCLVGVLLLWVAISAAEKGFFGLDLPPPGQLNDEEIDAFCTTCEVGMKRLIESENETATLIYAAQLCIDLHIGNDIFCDGFVEENAPEIIYIVDHAPNADPADVCGIVFTAFGCTTNSSNRIWEVTLPDTPKPVVNEPPLAGEGKPTLKVLHLADTHFDPFYYPGADTANCAEKYLCCREDNGIPVDPSDGAGQWGDYRECDIPKWTLEALYQHIKDNHQDIDFVIWTGDLIPHTVWNTSRELNLGIIHEMADLISTYFPDLKVFPAVGNHEASPVNLFPQPEITDPEFEISWLYNELNTVWQRWLPSDVADSIAQGAFYSTQIRPGLRIASINTQFCYGYNYWLVLDSTDIAKELESLANELQDAEDNGDFVYIIGHIPSGSHDCTLTWSHEFNRIVSRYESTISGIFYGHTHNDHYQLYFDPQNSSRVYEIAYIAQSQTTYSRLNPGYKIYTIEGDFNETRFRVLDHENYYLDLDETNARNESVISLLYTAKEFYNLEDLSPQSWLDLVYRMNEQNSTLFDGFYRNYVKAGRASLESGCNNRCKSDILCGLVTSDSSDKSHCENIN